MTDIQSKTVGAASWVLGSQVVSQAFSFAIGIALARMLSPNEFGLIAMVVVFTSLAGLLADVGMGAALVQNQNTSEKHFSSVFWLNVFLGASLTLAMYFFAPYIADFYNRPEIEGICRFLSINFIVAASGMTARQKLAKQLNFKALQLSEFVALITSAPVTIYMAYAGYGVWSLAVQLVLKQCIATGLIWIFSGWRPQFLFDKNAIKELFKFSGWVFSTNLLQTVMGKADAIIIGKFLNADALGLYDKSQSMMLYPLQTIASTMGSVMFPALSLIQADIQRVRSVYLRATRAVAFITFPMMVGIFVVAESFVLGVLGEQWRDVIPILRILCFAGVALSIVTLSGAVYLSQGAAALQFKVNLIYKPITLAGIIIGLNWGVTGVAVGFTLARLLNSAIALSMVANLIELKLLALLRPLAPSLVCAILMGLIVWLVGLSIDYPSTVVEFIVQVLVGGCVYLALVKLFRLDAFDDLVGVIKSVLDKR